MRLASGKRKLLLPHRLQKPPPAKNYNQGTSLVRGRPITVHLLVRRTGSNLSAYAITALAPDQSPPCSHCPGRALLSASSLCSIHQPSLAERPMRSRHRATRSLIVATNALSSWDVGALTRLNLSWLRLFGEEAYDLRWINSI